MPSFWTRLFITAVGILILQSHSPLARLSPRQLAEMGLALLRLFPRQSCASTSITLSLLHLALKTVSMLDLSITSVCIRMLFTRRPLPLNLWYYRTWSALYAKMAPRSSYTTRKIVSASSSTATARTPPSPPRPELVGPSMRSRMRSAGANLGTWTASAASCSSAPRPRHLLLDPLGGLPALLLLLSHLRSRLHGRLLFLRHAPQRRLLLWSPMQQQHLRARSRRRLLLLLLLRQLGRWCCCICYHVFSHERGHDCGGGSRLAGGAFCFSRRWRRWYRLKHGVIFNWPLYHQQHCGG